MTLKHFIAEIHYFSNYFMSLFPAFSIFLFSSISKGVTTLSLPKNHEARDTFNDVDTETLLQLINRLRFQLKAEHTMALLFQHVETIVKLTLSCGFNSKRSCHSAHIVCETAICHCSIAHTSHQFLNHDKDLFTR